MQVGELTGQLDECCRQLAEQQSKQQHLRQKVVKALRYPSFILLVAILLFTPLCAQLVRVDEDTGALDVMPARLAEWHEAQTLARADGLAASLESLMMVIGGIVGTLVIAMYLPVFGLGDAIR